MKKILMALAITAVAYTSAEAQAICGTNERKVCRHGSDNSVSCYETKYAQNYKVHKGSNGYYIYCGALENRMGDEAGEMAMGNGHNAYEAAFPEDNMANGVSTTIIRTTEEDAGEVTTTVIKTRRNVNCGRDEKQVCRKGADGKTECYKTNYAQNFEVCKGSAGYYICCDPPRTSSATIHPPRM